MQFFVNNMAVCGLNAAQTALGLAPHPYQDINQSVDGFALHAIMMRKWQAGTAPLILSAFVQIIRETHMDDNSQLLERVKEVGTAVWTVVGLLTGSPGITTGDAIAPRLMLSHDELKRIRSSV